MKNLNLLFILLFLAPVLFAQEIAVSPTKFNILYSGVQNPVKIVVENYDCDELTVDVSNGTIKKASNCEYYILPGKSKRLYVNVSGEQNGERKLLGREVFRIWELPKPDAYIQNRPGGDIPKSLLLNTTGILAKLRDFEFDVVFMVESYDVSILKGDEEIYNGQFEGDRFSKELKSKIAESNPGDKIIFKKIVAVSPDAKKYSLDSITFIIR
jgi:gliding motility-associated protein GldM